jgi:hypothetical protein
VPEGAVTMNLHLFFMATVLLIAVFAGLHVALVARLRTRHRLLWETLGEPVVRLRSSATDSQPLIHRHPLLRQFLDERQYTELDDALLRVLCAAARVAPLVFTSVWFAMFVVLLWLGRSDTSRSAERPRPPRIEWNEPVPPGIFGPPSPVLPQGIP